MVVMHHVQWGVAVPCMWVISVLHLRLPLRQRWMSVILPRFLLQQQEILFFLPWLTAAMWLISYKVPLSSPSCKDFSRAWAQCLHSAPASIQCPSACIVCGKSGMLATSYLGSSNCILPCKFHKFCQRVNLPSQFFSGFTSSHSWLFSHHVQ